MGYIIGIIMGYFIGTNAKVEKQANIIGMNFSHPIGALLSSLGVFGGWICILPSAYFVASSYGNGFLEGFLFVVAVFGGALLSGFFQIQSLRYLFSATTLIVNVSLTVLLFSIR